MSREQITGEAHLIGPASDLYAVAQIAYSMLVGAPYFEDEASSAGGNVLTLLLAVGQGPTEPASVRAARRGVTLPASFDAWFERSTRTDPRERYQAAREMIDALGRALPDAVAVAGEGVSPPRAVAAVTPGSASSVLGRTPGRALEVFYESTEVSGPTGPGSAPRSAPSSQAGAVSGGTVPIAPVAPVSGVPGSGPVSRVPEAAYQTGDAQSIPRPSSAASQGRSRASRWIAIALGALGLAAGATWVASRSRDGGGAGSTGGAPSGSDVRASAETARAARSTSALSESTEPVVTAVATSTASAGGAASASEPSASAPAAGATASASAVRPSAPTRPGRPPPATHPTGSPNTPPPPPPPPVWETR